MATAAVIGFRPHTYWTAAVALAGPSDTPQVLERRRIDFAHGHERFVFHQATELALPEARALIAAVQAATSAKAAAGIGALLTDLAGQGIEVRAAVVPTGRPRPSQPLEAVLKTHSSIHGAEGELYRDVVAAGCAAHGLDPRRVVEPHLPSLLAELLGLGEGELKARMATMGEGLGPPWSEDQRLAAQAAWLGLLQT